MTKDAVAEDSLKMEIVAKDIGNHCTQTPFCIIWIIRVILFAVRTSALIKKWKSNATGVPAMISGSTKGFQMVR